MLPPHLSLRASMVPPRRKVGTESMVTGWVNLRPASVPAGGPRANGGVIGEGEGVRVRQL